MPSWTSLIFTFCTILFVGCGPAEVPSNMVQSTLKNQAMQERSMLADMYDDPYFPEHVVDQCKAVLVEMCHRIETEQPKDLESLYMITHQATERLNGLQDVFEENDSEMETGARESLGMEFDFIAKAYGFDADVEELIAPREW